jgi:hypothetical protein
MHAMAGAARLAIVPTGWRAYALASLAALAIVVSFSVAPGFHVAAPAGSIDALDDANDGDN